MLYLMRSRFAVIIFLLASFAALPAWAASLPFSTAQASVLVECGTHRGSGAVTDVDHGYVITVGHLVIDPDTGAHTNSCFVDVVDDTLRPRAEYSAEVVRAVFDAKRDLDFAVLHITGRVGGPSTFPTAPLLTSEGAKVGDAVTIVGFPGSAGTMQTASDGTIKEFSRGAVLTDAVISLGSSGSPALDASGRLIGIAARISFITDPATGVERVSDYQFGDILALIAWLDTAGLNAHDLYLKHADPSAFHSAPYIIRDEAPGCLDAARTEGSDAVYCLLADFRRFVFPNASVFHSWYPDFSAVKLISLANIANYRLTGNITYKAGTLLKIQTDPKVYLVTDSIGTLRWVQTEARAAELFGEGWAAKVKDVPDAFFVDYQVAAPIP